MNDWNLLSASEHLPDRPFTNPDFTWQDHQVLQFAVDQLRRLFTQPQALYGRGAAEQTHCVEVTGRTHRFIITDPTGLLTLNDCVLVGFFGQRRASADADLVNTLDDALVEELIAHPGLLCYCTLELESGQFGNLVLFRDEQAKLHWSTSQRHMQAVRELSPKYYECVRLHNGHLPGGLLGGGAPVVQLTKYLDYRPMLPWRGLREFGGPPAGQHSSLPS